MRRMNGVIYMYMEGGRKGGWREVMRKEKRRKKPVYMKFILLCTLCAFLKMFVKMPSSQSPLSGLTQPNMSAVFSMDLGKNLMSLTPVGLPSNEQRVETTVLMAVLLPVAGLPATTTATVYKNRESTKIIGDQKNMS